MPDTEQRSWLGERFFSDYLTEQGYISRAILDQALRCQRRPDEKIEELLVRLEILSKETLHQAKAKFLGIPWVSLPECRFEAETAQLVAEEFAKRYCLIPFARSDHTLRVAMADPTDMQALEAVRICTGYAAEPVLASATEILAMIRQYLTEEKSLASMARLSGETLTIQEQEQAAEAHTRPGIDGPTIVLVDSLLQQAFEQMASDIHFEPQEQGLLIRFRIDGRLELYRNLPVETAESVIARIKVMAGLDIAERRLPQDGRMSASFAQRQIDLRVSTLPVVLGEKAVIRILDPLKAQRTLGELGLTPEVEKGVRHLIRQPSGLISIVGPTNSGKSTSLYALMREMDRQALNIISIEDPVEYRLAGINQTPVQARYGIDFAKGLRAILRQDPDVIVIGEIRDEETASIAMAAALTGHLVLSTMHTNSAAETLTRFLEMNIAPYLLASALLGVLSQRLVRLLCPACKKPRPLTDAERALLPLSGRNITLFEPVGCPRCRGKGYAGRMGIYELLVYKPSIKELILSQCSASMIEKAATEEGMAPILTDGLLKAGSGLTTLEEILHSAEVIL
ncbi:MAG: GspE/PulE family protein [Peptococcaceae bacterium]|jgi:type IV pilus assembly protein PilB|nr:GspE/PulE family protein [Peptococcaceae bacterium]